MENRMIKFIAALRSGGVRISLAESADAFKAVENLGIQERDAFRLGLRATLDKEAKDLGTFEELFPLFFDSGDAPPMMNLTEDMTPEEAQMLAEALRQFGGRLREMLERLLRGEELSKEELEALGQMVGLNQADNMRYREWMAKAAELDPDARGILPGLPQVRKYALEPAVVVPKRVGRVVVVAYHDYRVYGRRGLGKRQLGCKAQEQGGGELHRYSLARDWVPEWPARSCLRTTA